MVCVHWHLRYALGKFPGIGSFHDNKINKKVVLSNFILHQFHSISLPPRRPRYPLLLRHTKTRQHILTRHQINLVNFYSGVYDWIRKAKSCGLNTLNLKWVSWRLWGGGASLSGCSESTPSSLCSLPQQTRIGSPRVLLFNDPPRIGTTFYTKSLSIL